MKIKLRIMLILLCVGITLAPASQADAASYGNGEAVSIKETPAGKEEALRDLRPMAHSNYRPVRIGYGGSKGKRYEREVKRILAGIKKNWTPMEKVLYLHDYLIQHTTYAYVDGINPNYAMPDAYDCIVLKTAICNGYAEAFYDLANRAGIKTVQVISHVTDHAWNAVVLDGKWYYVDCTFDDMGTDPMDPSCSYSNFLKDESAMRETGHTGKDWIEAYWSDYYVPRRKMIGKCYSKKYNNYPWGESQGSGAVVHFTGGMDYYAPESGTVYRYSFKTGKKKKLLEDANFNYVSSMVKYGKYLFINNSNSVLCYDTKTKEKYKIFGLKKSDTVYGTGIRGIALIGKRLRIDLERTDNIDSVDFSSIISGSRYLDISQPKKLKTSYISLDNNGIVLEAKGEKYTLRAVGYNTGKLTWSSDNTAVASVKGGVVTARGEGACRITVTDGTISSCCVVDVRIDDTKNHKAVKVSKETPDTTWQQEYDYVLGKNDPLYKKTEYCGDMIIKGYHASASKLTVPAYAIISGKKYRTVISTLLSGNKTVKSVSFEEDVKFTNDAVVAKKCKSLESIDMRGCDTSDLLGTNAIVQSCPALKKVNLYGLNFTRFLGGENRYLITESAAVETVILPRYINQYSWVLLSDSSEWKTKKKGTLSVTSFRMLVDMPFDTKVYASHPAPVKMTFTVGNITYRVADKADHKLTVQKIKGSEAVIPSYVIWNNQRYTVTSIGSEAASLNRSLRKVTINSIWMNKIGKKAFYKCSNLRKIVVKSAKIQTFSKTAFDGICDGAVMLVPKERLYYYRDAIEGHILPETCSCKAMP